MNSILASVIEHAGSSSVKVVGSSALANELRTHLDASCIGTSLMVVVSPDPEDLMVALAEVDLLGTVLVVGELPENVEFDVYGLIHARGVRLVGVPPV